jgi:hypothetical protein
MAIKLGTTTLNKTFVFSVDTDPSINTGLAAPIGSMAIAMDGSGIFFKSNSGDTNWSASTGGGGGSFTGGTLTSALNEAKSSNIAGATTIDLATSTGNLVHVTGSTWTSTSLGILPAGSTRELIFDGVGTLVYNATSLILQGGTDIITDAGGRGFAISEGSGNWRLFYFSFSTDFINYVTSWTGFSSNPVVDNCRYNIIPGTKTMVFYLSIYSSGASNSTTKTFTLPFNSKNSQKFVGYGLDNNTPVHLTIVTRAGSNIVDAYVSPLNSWTGSGLAQVNVTMTVEIV